MFAFAKRMFLFLAMNLAVILVLTAVSFVLERFFGIRISANAGGYAGLAVFALVYGFIGSFVSLWLSKWMAKNAYGITILSESRLMDYSSKEQLVYATVARIAKENGISVPEVGVYESADPNAFATGATKNSSLVAVSSGLLDSMSASEIEGVIGHEMAHILNGDMVTMTLLQGVINAFVIFAARVVGGIIDKAVFKNEEGSGIGYYATVFVLEIVFSVLASVILMWFSRYREYRADEGASKYMGKDKMIAALKRLQSLTERTEAYDDGNLATMKIASKSSFLSFFSSHPPLEKRIANLESKVVF
ncbi:MAG: Protease HtpX [Patescibacteria group bacterium]|nr:Protease HtpX [Patescibacteria group bacterium]